MALTLCNVASLAEPMFAPIIKLAIAVPWPSASAKSVVNAVYKLFTVLPENSSWVVFTPVSIRYRCSPAPVLLGLYAVAVDPASLQSIFKWAVLKEGVTTASKLYASVCCFPAIASICSDVLSILYVKLKLYVLVTVAPASVMAVTAAVLSACAEGSIVTIYSAIL